ncbi:hypothetical protein MNBD_GAMMA08-1780 [hydrothermal vent metagenome]|uniref:VWFA domain-containing protein n=1 Tax=hydrothermal vent metagenome TaxID=652676 RepID=A0A3B0XNC1_9ZZZZ
MEKINNVGSRGQSSQTLSIFGMAFLFLAIGSLLSSCAQQNTQQTDRTLIYRSLSNLPLWVTNLPSNPDYFYALGISTNTPSIRKGRLAAARDAAVEVSRYLGLKAESRFEMQSTELTRRIINEMTVSTSAQLEGISLSQMYYEEYLSTNANKNKKENVFDVYVLLRIPMDDLLQEQARQKLKKGEMLSEINKTNEQAEAHLRNGNFPLAWQKWMLAMRLLDEGEKNNIASLQIYRSLLTAVEGLKLSVNTEGDSANVAKNNLAMVPHVTAQALFTNHGDAVVLKGLPLHFRLVKNTAAGKIKRTNSSGQVKYFFPKKATRELEIRLVMSSFAVDRAGISSQLSQKITFLETLLENKVTHFGDVNSAQAGVLKSKNKGAQSQAFTYVKKEQPINVSVMTNNAYAFLGGNNQNISLTLKVDVMPGQSENMWRPPLNLSVVIDKSASMNSDGKIDYTKKATAFLVDHLTPQDHLSIVAYNESVDVVSPTNWVSSPGVLKHHISEIEAEGMTNVSGGLFEGYAQVKKNMNAKGVNRILLLSDGRANRGIIQTKGFVPYAKKYAQEGISISALGVGDDYNEELLVALADGSKGNYYYIKNPEDIPGIFSQELTRLVSVAAKNVWVNIELKPGVELLDSFGQPYTQISENKYQFGLGDIHYGGRGILLLELSGTAAKAGEKKLAVVNVSYDDTNSKAKVEKVMPVSVNFTRNVDLIKNAVNQQVEKYVLLARSIEQLEKVLETMDEGLYENAINSLNQTYSSLDAFARTTEDAEFTQRMEFLKHFTHEIEELQESGGLHEHNEQARKNLGYQLYLEKHSHRTLQHPLHSEK